MKTRGEDACQYAWQRVVILNEESNRYNGGRAIHNLFFALYVGYKNKNGQTETVAGLSILVPHIGELSNQYKEDLRVLYQLKYVLTVF